MTLTLHHAPDFASTIVRFALEELELPHTLAIVDIDGGALASRVSIHPHVREALFERQRAFATQAGGAVLDGRDIGTVIAPDAEVKLFVTARTHARAQRRWAEMQARGEKVTLAEIEADLRRRDERDRTRATAPLVAADGAIVIDTTDMGIDEAIAAAIAAVERLTK